MLKKITSAIDSLRNKKPHQPTQLTRRVATIDMTGIDDLSDEEKLRVFDLAMQDALKGKSTIANPNQKPPYIQTGERVREKFGISLNLQELQAQNAYRADHMDTLIKLLTSGGVEKARDVYSITELQADGMKKYFVSLIDTDTEKFSCELEITSKPRSADLHMFHSFRASNYVSTLEGNNVRLDIFIDEHGVAHYDVKELEG